jgi:hypothetical protein
MTVCAIYCVRRYTEITYCIVFKLLVLIHASPCISVFVPHAHEVPLPVDERAFSCPRTLLGGDGGAEILVGGLVGAADIRSLMDRLIALTGTHAY